MRRSPSSSSSVQEPPPKRAAVFHPATVAHNADVVCCDEREEEPSVDDGADAAFSTPVKPSPPVANQITGYMSTQEVCGNGDVPAPNTKLGEESKINSMTGSPSPATGTLPPLPRATSAPIPSEYLPVEGGASLLQILIKTVLILGD